jgi:hypothetical protein
LKRFYKVVLEVDISSQTELTLTPLYDYGASGTPNSEAYDASVSGGGGIIGEAVVGYFYIGNQIVGEAFADIQGIGKTLSLYIRSEDTYQQPHTLQGAIFHYAPRGLVR